MNKKQAKITRPTKKELIEIYARDTRCVYCHKKFDKNKEIDKPSIEHLNHRQDWDSVAEYQRTGKSVSEILAICCKSCNSSRGPKPLSEWFKTKFCLDKNINYQTVAEVVRKYIDKYEK